MLRLTPLFNSTSVTRAPPAAYGSRGQRDVRHNYASDNRMKWVDETQYNGPRRFWYQLGYKLLCLNQECLWHRKATRLTTMMYVIYCIVPFAFRNSTSYPSALFKHVHCLILLCCIFERFWNFGPFCSSGGFCLCISGIVGSPFF